MNEYERLAEAAKQNVRADNERWLVGLVLAVIATAALVVIAWKI